MPDPVNYTQTKNLVTPVATAVTNLNTALDAEVTKIGTSLNGAVNAIKDLRAADGTLKPATVGAAQLKPEIKFAYVNKGNWAASVAYAINDCVFYNSNAYACRVAHTSVAAQTPDKIPANWTLIADLAALTANALVTTTVPGPVNGTIPRNIPARLNEYVSVKDFGAVGDGVTDDTAAMQRAFTWVAAHWSTDWGRKLYIPKGAYKLTDTLYLGDDTEEYGTYGVVIEGASQTGSILLSYATNKPIIKIRGNLHTQWEISRLRLVYAEEQTGTSANCIYVGNDTPGLRFGIYNSSFHHLYFENAFYAIASFSPSNIGDSFWGMRFDTIQCENMLGGFIYFTQTGGEPSNSLRNFHINSSRCVGPIFYTVGHFWVCSNIEINNVQNLGGPGGLPGSGSLPQELLNPLLSGDSKKQIAGILDNFYGFWTFDTLHIESMGVVSNIVMFFNWGGMMKAKLVEIFNDLHVPENVTVFGFDTSNSGIQSHIETFRFKWSEPDVHGPFVLTPGHHGPAKPNQLRIFSFASDERPNSENFFISQYNNNSAGTEYLTIDGWNDPSSEKFEADADLTLPVDAVYAHTFKTQTANRIVTLPPSIITYKGANYTNLFSGRKFKITKRNTANFTITVKDSTNNVIATLPAGKKGWVEVSWNKGDTPTEWQVIGQGAF